MGTMDDLSEAGQGSAAGAAGCQQKPLAPAGLASPLHVGRARLEGFDPAGQPLVGGMTGGAGQTIAARTTVALPREALGAEVLLVWEPASVPIIFGIVQPLATQPAAAQAAPERLSVRADAQEYLVSAEREIVLQCGDASITLTRAGKVIIKGNYVVSRSSGYNKIKGAAVDIN